MADEKVDKMDKQVLVVPREILFGPSKDNFSGGEDYFQGFSPVSGIDYIKRIIERVSSHPSFERRGDVEKNPQLQQIIAYTAVVNPGTQQIFLYQRSSKSENYIERRLQQKLTMGLGGHINLVDVGQSRDPIRESRRRELGEEVIFEGARVPREEDIDILGCINDDLDDVGTVHFGILSVAKTNATRVLPSAPEIARAGRGRITPGLKTLDELEEIFGDKKYVVEGWTQIIKNRLKGYVLNL